MTIKARRFTGRHIWRAADGMRGYYGRRTSHAAGFTLAAAATASADEDTNEKIQSITIEFQSQKGMLRQNEHIE